MTGWKAWFSKSWFLPTFCLVFFNLIFKTLFIWLMFDCRNHLGVPKFLTPIVKWYYSAGIPETISYKTFMIPNRQQDRSRLQTVNTDMGFASSSLFFLKSCNADLFKIKTRCFKRVFLFPVSLCIQVTDNGTEHSKLRKIWKPFFFFVGFLTD